MAVKVAPIWHGMYIGDMSEQRAENIMKVREAKCVDGLKHMIFDFPIDMIKRSFDEEKSIRQIIKEENLDWKQYIAELRDYQTVGTAFMYISPRSIIADGCGLGKTAEVAALINWIKQEGTMTKFLMAVETSALGQMQCELIRFTGLNIVAMPSEAPKIRKCVENVDWTHVDGIVIKHSTLRSDEFSKWVATYMNPDGTCRLFNTFFLDESSVIKNSNTKMYTYTQNICNICNRVHFMNATAFETSILDVYNQLDLVNPDLLPKKWRIEKDFCVYHRKSYWTKVNGKAQINYSFERTGYKNQEAFKQSLKLVYFGRSKKDIGMNTPSIYKVYEVDPTKEMLAAIKGGYRYNEVLNCPSLIPDIKIDFDRKSVPKLDRLCTLIENDFSDSSVMVYCFHLEAQKVIANELIKIGRKPCILNGECNDEERYRIQSEFNKGNYDVIITDIKKSLNLYGGDVCIFYSNETNPSKSFQIASRIDRNVDNRTKTFILLLYNGTPEYDFFVGVVRQRAKDARDLTIDAKTTVDYFWDSMNEEENTQ